MARPKKVKQSFAEKLRLIKAACLKTYQETPPTYSAEIDELNDRIKKIIGVYNQHSKKNNTMIYFIMYDIENNKIRQQIAKFLERKGCIRIQKSIFIADTDRKTYQNIYQTLKEVNDIYENYDSILLVPVSTDEIKAMKVIGHDINLDMITGDINTLFV